MGESTEGLRTGYETNADMSEEDRRTEQINRDIERTRAQLSQNVDELGDKVSPSQVMERRKQAAKGKISGLKDKVMGSSHDSGGSLSDRTSSMSSSVSDTASGTMQGIQERTEGNPLAAGVIAFGIGLLASSAFPATRVEQRVAQQGVDAAKDTGLVDEAKSVAGDMGDQLKETAKSGAEEVKGSAQSSAENLKEQGKDSAQQVKEQRSS